MAEERVQRRLAAILAADVVGYSRLMGEDEEGTLATLTAHLTELIEPCIAEYRGRVVKTTGDGLLAEFASVVDAVRCAVAFQEGMRERNGDTAEDRRFLFRIGVNLGDVLVEHGDVFGDGVNVAARLEQIAEPGGICLSEDVYRQIRGKLKVAVADAGEQRLKNISRPIRVYRIDASLRAAAPAPLAAARRSWREFVPAIIGAAVVVGIAATGVWYLLGRDAAEMPQTTQGQPDVARAPLGRDAAEAPRTTQSQPDVARAPPIVAVLPFANLTGEESQEYFADGVTEEVINALGRFNTLRVIGRNAVLPYKKRPPTRDEISTILGAHYLVEGSVRRSDRHVRIVVQLTSARDGTVLWAERYDGKFSNLFDFQDAIARQIAGTFAANITQIEGRRSLNQPRPKPDAHDLVLRARAAGFAATRTANRRFRELMTQAVEMDPGYATAHALLAEGLYAQAVLGWTEFPDRAISRAEALARRAIALAPDEPDGHRALGRVLVVRGEHREAVNELRRATEINPSDSTALAGWGAVLSFNGDLDGAINAIVLARRYDPMLEPVYVLDLSIAYYLARRHDDAIRVAEEGVSRFPNFGMFYVPAAAAAARLGDSTRAARYIKEIRLRLPFLDLDAIGSRFKDPSHAAYLVEALRLAGF